MPTVDRKTPKGSHTQSVLFERKIWTEKRARKWLKKENMFSDSLETTDDFFRFRQYNPDRKKFNYKTVDNTKKGFEDLPNGIKLVNAIKK